MRKLKNENVEGIILFLKYPDYIHSAKSVLSTLNIPIYISSLNFNKGIYKQNFLLNFLINELWSFRKVLFITDSCKKKTRI